MPEAHRPRGVATNWLRSPGRSAYRRGEPTMGAIGSALLGGSMPPVAARHASPMYTSEPAMTRFLNTARAPESTIAIFTSASAVARSSMMSRASNALAARSASARATLTPVDALPQRVLAPQHGRLNLEPEPHCDQHEEYGKRALQRGARDQFRQLRPSQRAEQDPHRHE